MSRAVLFHLCAGSVGTRSASSETTTNGQRIAAWDSAGPIVAVPVFSTVIVRQKTTRLILTFDATDILAQWREVKKR